MVFHLGWAMVQNPHRHHRLHRHPPVFILLPRAVLEKILQILPVWLSSSVPHRKSWKRLPAVFPSIHSHTLWRLFLELFQQVCAYGFLLDGINNSYNNSWILLSSQVILGNCYIIKKSDSAEYAKIVALVFLVCLSWCHEWIYPQVLISRRYLFNGSII